MIVYRHKCAMNVVWSGTEYTLDVKVGEMSGGLESTSYCPEGLQNAASAVSRV